MPKPVVVRGAMKVIVHAEHRNGICENCGSKMEVRQVLLSSVSDKVPQGKDRMVSRAICPSCGGGKGCLIAAPISIQAPYPPQCLSIKCLWRFVADSIFVALLSTYHYRRVAYAEANRPEKKQILERYRTGVPAPENIWQAIHAIIKLKCPICRKYNVDPLLFRRKRNGSD